MEEPEGHYTQLVNQTWKDGATIILEESRKGDLIEAERIVDARAWGWGAKERWRGT